MHKLILRFASLVYSFIVFSSYAYASCPIGKELKTFDGGVLACCNSNGCEPLKTETYNSRKCSTEANGKPVCRDLGGSDDRSGRAQFRSRDDDFGNSPDSDSAEQPAQSPPNTARQPAAQPEPQKTPAEIAKEQADEKILEAQSKAYQYENELNECSTVKEKATVCCATPEKCIKEAIGGMGGASAQFAIQALQFIGTGAIAISAGGGATKICETTGAVAAGGAALSTAMAGLCGKKVDQCVKICGDLKERVEAERANVCGSVAGQYKGNCELAFADILRKVNSRTTDCQRADVATVEKGASAMGALMAAKMADYCKQQTTAGTTPGLQQNLFNIDCTSAGAATNPICQNPCMRDATSQECMNQIAAMGQNPNGGMGGPGVLIIWAGRSQ